MKTKLFILFLFSLHCCKNSVSGQKIELKEVYIECNQINQNDSILYEPYRISFTFYAMNNTKSGLSFGAFNPYAGGKIRFGYFEIEFDKKKKYDLKSFTSDRQICLHPNDSLRFLTELRDSDFSIRGKSFSEIYNLVLNSRMLYNCIEKHYKNEKDCKFETIFHSQEVIKNDYLILFCYNGRAVHYYYVKPNF